VDSTDADNVIDAMTEIGSSAIAVVSSGGAMGGGGALGTGDPNVGDIDVLTGGRDDLTEDGVLLAGSSDGWTMIDDGGTGVVGTLSTMRHEGAGIAAMFRDVAPDGIRLYLLEDNVGASWVTDDDGGAYHA
jgi:hypothetical protein